LHIHQFLKIPLDQLNVSSNFSEFGFDSINLVKFAKLISKHFGFNITPAKLFANPTIGALADYLRQEYAIPAAADDAIAIIGISGKFPQADNLEAYWENLLQGRNCISEIPKERWDWNDNKTDVKWGGFINGIQKFDPQFFGITPQEAELMDPQHRLLMTYTYKAIEDAGYHPKVLANTATGVFIAIGNNGYNSHFPAGNLPSIAPNRISYFFDLHGPSEPVETACASSLVAIHKAINEINNGTCDVAIVGGINTIVTPAGHRAFTQAGLLSKDGRCKPFSSEADGFVRAEGIGVLILKRLSLAEKDNDHIYGVLRGSGVNHNGRSNFLTAPNPNAQCDLLESVYKKSGIDINTVTYIETHGTGTELGDAIEIEGLKNAFKKLNGRQKNCAIGSVKANIGHTEIASGMASIIKVLYQMKHKMLVKSIHCDTINPHLQLENSPFYVVKDNQTWERMKDQSGAHLPLRAGVSSFGLGGVNAHIIVEEYIAKSTVTRMPLPGYEFKESNYWITKNNPLFLKWYGSQI
ncbi:MAG: thioester reductase, partial [Gammaproteobacteria bacterium]